MIQFQAEKQHFPTFWEYYMALKVCLWFCLGWRFRFVFLLAGKAALREEASLVLA